MARTASLVLYDANIAQNALACDLQSVRRVDDGPATRRLICTVRFKENNGSQSLPQSLKEL